MESRAIPDGKLSASTEWNSKHAAKQARLYFPAGPGIAGSWSSRANDANQWLQIDLGIQNAKVTGLASQGRADCRSVGHQVQVAVQSRWCTLLLL